MAPHESTTPQPDSELFHLIADFTYDWEYLRGPDGSYRYCSPACERITGYPAADFFRDPGLLLRIVLPEDRPLLQEHHRLAARGSEHSIDFRIRTRDGQQRWINHVCQPVFDADGAWAGQRGSNRDISARKRTELEMTRQRDLASAILSTAGALIVVLDRQGRIVRFNETCERTTGYAAREVVGKTFWEFLLVADEVQSIREEFARICLGRIPSHHENDWLTKDGQRRRVAWSNTFLRDGQGEVEYVIGIGVDVTQQRLAETERQEMLARMEEDREAIEQLLAENRTQREFLERLIESAPMGVAVVHGPDHVFELVNPCFAAIPGTCRSRMVGRPFAEVFPTLSAEHGGPLIEKAYRTGQTVSVRGERVPAGPGWKETYWDVDHVPLPGATGSVERVLILAHEVTDEVLAQQGLQESEERLRTLFEILPIGISILDRQRRIAFSNPALEESVELSSEELAKQRYEQRRYLRADGTEMPAAEFPSIRALEESRVIRDVEIGVVKEDGEQVWTSVSAVPFPAPDWSALVATVDITERKRLEEALRRAHAELELRVEERTAELVQVAEALRAQIAERTHAEQELRLSEERFRQLAENIDEVFWLMEPNSGRYLYVSPAYETLWGRPRDDLYRRAAAFLDAVHPQDRDRIVGAWENHRQDFDEEFRIVRPDGAVRWARARAFPIRDSQGKVQRMAGIAKDITADRQAQAALLQAEKHTIASRLAASLAHEISNPLQSAIGCLELGLEALQEGTDPGGYMRVTAEALAQAASVVSQLRTLHQPSRLEPKRPADLNGLVTKTLLLSKKQCRDRDVAVSWTPAPDLPEMWLIPDALQQVFLNIVLNALDAMPEGGELRICTAASAQPPGASIEFADSGVGIPPKVMDSLFESFASTKAEGLGLGLFVSQDIVQQHGGRIEVESEEGEGATFTVWLPAGPDPAAGGKETTR